MFEQIKEKIIAFFTKGHERTILTKKNIAASFGIKIITILITLCFVPLTIDYVDSDRYGIFVVLSSMVGWLALFDIGFGNGLRNKFAEAKAKGELGLAKRYVSSTYAIIILLWIGIFILFALINPYLDWGKILKNVSPEYQSEVNSLIWVCVSSFGIVFILRLLSSLVTADQRPAIASFIEMLGQLLALIGVFILLKTTSPSLVKLGFVVGFSPVVVYIIASIILYNGRYKKFRPSIKHIEFKLAKEMFSLGGKFFVATIAAFVIVQTISFLIMRIAGPEQTANYDTAYKIFSVAFNVMSIIIIPYWTSFTDAYTLKDFEWMKGSIKRLRQVYILFIVFQVLLLVCSGIIYNIWIGDRLDISFSMSLAVFLFVGAMCWTNINIYPINGIGKVKLQLYSSIIEMIIVIPLAIWMGKHFGAPGIVITPVLVYIPRMIWAPIQLNRLINQKAEGIWNK